MMKPANSVSTFTYGCDIISQKLKYCLSPMGLLFKFHPNPPKQPKPLAMTVVLIILSTIFITIANDLILTEWHRRRSVNINLALESPFVASMMKIAELNRLASLVATSVIATVQHGTIANLMATKNYLVSKKDQVHFASAAFAVFLFCSLLDALCSLPLYNLSNYDLNELLYSVIMAVAVNSTNVTSLAPIIYICYLGSLLGKHVENFSELHVHTMFDQFMKAIETVEKEGSMVSELSVISDASDEGEKRNRLFGCIRDYAAILIRFFERFFVHLVNRLRRMALHLNSRKYPELPEMSMSKLSTATSLNITNSMRISNSHLIRVRLRKSQVMLSELRDVVSDINKMSSAIIFMNLIMDLLKIIVITTSSIQSKTYKSVNIMIIPTMSTTICLVVKVVYVCTCLDATSSQLKLMINKLFDFIIMNHRVHSSKSRTQFTDDEYCTHQENPEVRLAAEREDEAISETWSQFQYTRKLANTIQFTMGGILPVNRRLVLSVLGHILSAVFVAIEIMNIVDTSGQPATRHSTASKSARSNHNSFKSV